MKIAAGVLGELLGGAWSRDVKGVHLDAVRFAAFSTPGNALALVRSDERSLGLSPQWIKANQHRVTATAGVMSTPVTPDLPHLVITDVAAALYALGRHARRQMYGKVYSVIGSAGKTSVTNMLGHVLRKTAPGRKTYIFGSGNTPPYIAAELFSAPHDADFHAIEIAGASHPEDVPLGKVSASLARPDVCIFTSLSPAHMDRMRTMENAAATKAAAFEELADGGAAIINRDMPHFDIAVTRTPAGRRIITFGRAEAANFRLLNLNPADGIMQGSGFGSPFTCRFGPHGAHMALNSLGVLAALAGSDIDWRDALPHLQTWKPLRGRGRRFLLRAGAIEILDEAYNANPGSMAAALTMLGDRPCRRRVAVLGEMRELGDERSTTYYHTDLAGLVSASNIDVVHVTGPAYAGFWHQIPAAKRGIYASSLNELKAGLASDMQDGDCMMLKGSNASHLHEVVTWLEALDQDDTDCALAGRMS